MKLRIAVLPVLVFALFGYSWSIADRVSDHGTVKLTKAAIVAEVKADLAKFKPSTVVIYNK